MPMIQRVRGTVATVAVSGVGGGESERTCEVAMRRDLSYR
jgi:hypothetical protein